MCLNHCIGYYIIVLVIFGTQIYDMTSVSTCADLMNIAIKVNTVFDSIVTQISTYSLKYPHIHVFLCKYMKYCMSVPLWIRYCICIVHKIMELHRIYDYQRHQYYADTRFEHIYTYTCDLLAHILKIACFHHCS